MKRGRRISVVEALAKLPAEGGLRFAKLFEHGTLEVEMAASRRTGPRGRPKE